MKTLLLTGGCGFIGSNFLRRFIKTHSDWKVINLDKLTYSGNLENTQEVQNHPHYEFVQGDIGDRVLVSSLMKKVDAVINFAAETHVDRSIENAGEFLSTNVLGSQTILEAARLRGIQKFIHISTDEVYGSIEKGSVSENAPLLPNSPYAASKAAVDLLIRSYQVTYKYFPMIVRASNNFGPYQFPEKVIPLFVTHLLENKKIPLYSKGENMRDWLFVEDNCAAIELVFDRGKEGEIYNIGAGNEITNLELARTILQEMGFGEEMIQYVADRPGHDFRYSVDVEKIRKLGFKPQASFREALRKTIQWYRDHHSWWKKLKHDKYTVK